MLRPNRWFGWSRSNPDVARSLATNPPSLDQLKLLHALLEKNQTVSESNRTLLVETLRQIAEILIWGDQNDSSVFDFFLEKNMLSFFLKIMKQKCGGFVCTQLLQTLNILFENIRNETSLYYLLSNNHVNSIIVHKFDFNDEEVMAYYISFLKTLSLKLNAHTIHFFFNEQTADFPLYTEAIKFFNHSEKMVRIAVRTLTLNVFRVREQAMLKFIRDCTAAPYFSNLTWFIGNHVFDINSSLIAFVESRRRTSVDVSLATHRNNANLVNRLEDLIAEHLDHLHYLNDILLLNIDDLNTVLTDNLLYRLIIPLYVYSFLSIGYRFLVTRDLKFFNLEQDFCQNLLSRKSSELNNNDNESETSDTKKTSIHLDAMLSPTVALFLLCQTFLIFSYKPLLTSIVKFLLNSDKNEIDTVSRKCEFSQPNTSLEAAIEQALMITPTKTSPSSSLSSSLSLSNVDVNNTKTSQKSIISTLNDQSPESSSSSSSFLQTIIHNVQQQKPTTTLQDDKIAELSQKDSKPKIDNNQFSTIDWPSKPFLVALLASLNATIINSSTTSSQVEDRNSSSSKSNISAGSNNNNEKHSDNDSLYKFCHNSKTVKMLPEISSTDDRIVIFSLTLIYSLINNNAIDFNAFRMLFWPPPLPSNENMTISMIVSDDSFGSSLINSLLFIIRKCCSTTSSTRLVTFELAVFLFRRIVFDLPQSLQRSSSESAQCFSFSDHQLALIEQSREDTCHYLRQYFGSINKQVFLGLFETQAKLFVQKNWNQSQDVNESSSTSETFSLSSPSKIWSFNPNLTFEQLFMDANLLLPPSEMTNSMETNLYLRLPEIDYERTRYIIQVFFILRRLSFDVRKFMGDSFDEKLSELEILLNDASTNNPSVTLNKFIDLDNCDLNSCIVSFFYPIDQKRSNSRYSSSAPGSRSESPLINYKRVPRFMTVLSEMIVLIEPDDKRYGWGVVKFLARLQDCQILLHVKDLKQVTLPPLPEKDDNKSLYIQFNQFKISTSLESSSNSSKFVRSSFAQNTLVARFQFNDAVRCLVARNNLQKAQKKVLDVKISAIASLIDYPLISNSETSHSSKKIADKNHQPELIFASNSNTNSNIGNVYLHSMLNRTFAVVPGVAVPSKHLPQRDPAATLLSSSTNNDQLTNHSQQVFSNHQKELGNKKRYAYPPAALVQPNNRTKMTATTAFASNNQVKNEMAAISISGESRRPKKKSKLKYPNSSVATAVDGTENEIFNEAYGIPLNDFSPKNLRKNCIEELNATTGTSAVIDIVHSSSTTNSSTENLPNELETSHRFNQSGVGSGSTSNSIQIGRNRSETFDI